MKLVILIIAALYCGTISAQFAATATNAPCFATRAGLNSAACTANDVRLASITAAETSVPECIPGSTFTITGLTFEFVTGSAQRYDAGLFLGGLGEDGDSDDAKFGTCLVAVLPFGPDPLFNFDITQNPDTDNACGEVRTDSSVSITEPTASFEVTCTDRDGDGFADIPSCVTWENNQQDRLRSGDCDNGAQFAAEDITGIQANTGSKCACNPVQLIPIRTCVDCAISCAAPQSFECTGSNNPGDYPSNPPALSGECRGDVTFTDSITDIRDVPCENQGRTWTRTWSIVNDCDGAILSCDQQITVTDTVAPTFSGVPADSTQECGPYPAPADVTASDLCDDDVPVSVSTSDSGTICDGSRTYTYTATDDCGNTATASYTVTTLDNSAPVFSGVPADETIQCLPYPDPATVTASDNCDADPSVSVSFTDVGDSCTGERRYTYTATDDCGNSATDGYTIFRDDTTAPSIVCPADEITGACPVQLPGTEPTGTDNCGGIISYTSSTIQGENSITVVWTGTDACGNAASCSVTYRCIPPQGCTYTQGYWKTHSTYGPAGPPDETWDQYDNGDAQFFEWSVTWRELWATSPSGGNAYVSSAHQWMAAELNRLNNGLETLPDYDCEVGACFEYLESVYEGISGDEWSTNPPAKGSEERSDIIRCGAVLAAFNEGLCGPGHCDDDEFSFCNNQ